MDTTPVIEQSAQEVQFAHDVAEAASKMVSRGDAVEMIMNQTGCSLLEAEQTLQAVEASKIPQKLTKQPEPEVVLESQAKVERRITIRNMTVSTGRNDKCGCGSGKKFKKCCLGKTGERLTREVVKDKILVTDPEVAKQLAKHQRAGKTVRMIKQ